jgi:hypothetical protein
MPATGTKDPDTTKRRPTTTVEQRLAEPTASLHRARTGLHEAFDRVHPTPGCLPLPTLTIPVTPQEYGPALDALADALYSPDCSGFTDAWQRATTACPHLPAHTVCGVRFLIERWYQYLGGARRHVEDGCQHWPYDLAWHAYWLPKHIATHVPPPQR